jgi:hypothetical protein
MLRWSFEHWAPALDTTQLEKLDEFAVKGNYALHAYAIHFWVDHVRSHAQQCTKTGSEVDSTLSEELRELLKIHKSQKRLLDGTNMHGEIPRNRVAGEISDLNDLMCFGKHPHVQIFVQDCLRFYKEATKRQRTSKSTSGR